MFVSQGYDCSQSNRVVAHVDKRPDTATATDNKTILAKQTEATCRLNRAPTPDKNERTNDSTVPRHWP